MKQWQESGPAVWTTEALLSAVTCQEHLHPTPFLLVFSHRSSWGFGAMSSDPLSAQSTTYTLPSQSDANNHCLCFYRFYRHIRKLGRCFHLDLLKIRESTNFSHAIPCKLTSPHPFPRTSSLRLREASTTT